MDPSAEKVTEWVSEIFFPSVSCPDYGAPDLKTFSHGHGFSSRSMISTPTRVMAVSTLTLLLHVWRVFKLTVTSFELWRLSSSVDRTGRDEELTGRFQLQRARRAGSQMVNVWHDGSQKMKKTKFRWTVWWSWRWCHHSQEILFSWSSI